MPIDQLQEYNALWTEFETRNFLPELLRRGFTFHYEADIQNPDVLFVGINPSFDERYPEIRNTYGKCKPGENQYFNSFFKIADFLQNEYEREITWTHLDFLVFRETNQKFIWDVLLNKNEPHGVEFVYRQVLIARERIEELRPKLILVSNTMSRELMGRNQNEEGTQGVWMGYQFEFDKQIGTDRIISEGVMNGTPVLFSSMLSGQRALDKGSFERLVWQMDLILKTSEDKKV